MRRRPAIGHLAATCILLASILPACPAETALRDPPYPKIVKWNVSVPITILSQYTGLAVGLDGRIWVSDLWDREFLIFDRFRKFTTISSGSFAPLWMTRGADGDLYAVNGDTDILKVDPTGNMTTITLGQVAYSGISEGPDGSVWVPEQSEVGRIFLDGTVREYPMLSGDMVEIGTSVTQVPGGDVWFVAYTPDYAHYLASMNPYSGAITKHGAAHACGTGTVAPLIAAPDGRVWVVCGDLYDGYEFDGFGPIDVTRVPWPGDLGFTMVGGYDNAAIGPDNAIWIVGQNVVNNLQAGGAILRFDLVTHKLHKYLPPDENYDWANGLTFDARGNLWAGTNSGEIQEVILQQ